jgi:hypothetical protein
VSAPELPGPEVVEAARAMLRERALYDSLVPAQRHEDQARVRTAVDAFREVNRTPLGYILPYDESRDFHDARLILAYADALASERSRADAAERELRELKGRDGRHA